MPEEGRTVLIEGKNAEKYFVSYVCLTVSPTFPARKLLNPGAFGGGFVIQRYKLCREASFALDDGNFLPYNRCRQPVPDREDDRSEFLF